MTPEQGAALLKAVDDACEQLQAWLTDRTELAFEEEPEIDGIRAELLDAHELASAP